MSVIFEWCCEEVNDHGDVLELHFCASRAEAEALAKRLELGLAGEDCARVDVCLIRNVIRLGALADRQYAYLIGGKLPPQFSGGAKMLKNFLQ